MNKTILLFIVSNLCLSFLESQNLIPNPSFEKAKLQPKRWMGTFDDFNTAAVDWTSPTQASPDLFYVHNMPKYKNKRPHINLADYKPRTGNYMVGMKVFGCESKTLHCKEYIQVKLIEPLKSGEEYIYEYWVLPVEKTIKVNSFAISGSLDERKERMNSGLLDSYPLVIDEKIITWNEGGWQRISGKFTSDNDYNYVIFGNFFDDDIVESQSEEDGMDYAYYFFDDMSIKPVHSKKVEKKYEVGASFTLDNIAFEFDKSTLLPNSYSELNEIVRAMKNQPNLTIEIHGHTDNVGQQSYNQQLSEQRALAVLKYFKKHGIDSSRMISKGFGSRYPVIDNNSDEHKKMNRRVEVKFGIL